MTALVLIVLAILLFGGGFALNILWYVAIVVVVIAGINYVSGHRRVGG